MAETKIVKLEESKDVQDDKDVDHSTANAMKKCFHSVKVSNVLKWNHNLKSL